MVNTSGRAGAFRQEAFTRQSLQAAARHEERKDVTGRGDEARGIKGRVVRAVPPLVWRDGSIQTPIGWSADGAWDCGLEADYEMHVAGVRRHGKVGNDLGWHALVQFPASMPVEAEADERHMLQTAVTFVDRIHGGQAVFHARLDRDEDGRRTVDVFFVPIYEKAARKGATKSSVTGQRWASLSKHQKDLAASQGLTVDKVGRGRALQTAWFEYLRDELGLEWAERGDSKKRGRDRVEPEIYKLRREREAAEKACLAAREAQAGLRALEAGLLERESTAARREADLATTNARLQKLKEDLEGDRQKMEKDLKDQRQKMENDLEDERQKVLQQQAEVDKKNIDIQNQHKKFMRLQAQAIVKIQNTESALFAGMHAFMSGDIVSVNIGPDKLPQIHAKQEFETQEIWKLIMKMAAEVVRLLLPVQKLFSGIAPEKRRESEPAINIRRRTRGMEM